MKRDAIRNSFYYIAFNMSWSESDEDYYSREMLIEQREKDTDKIVNSCLPFYLAFILFVIVMFVIWIFREVL